MSRDPRVVGSCVDRIALAGGSRGTKTDAWATTQAWCFPLKEAAWRPVAPMRKARTNHASAALNGEIYAVGGKASPLRPGWLAQAPLQPGGLSVLQQPSPTPMPLPGTREPPCWFRAPEALLPILPLGARCLGQTSHTGAPSQCPWVSLRQSLGSQLQGASGASQGH